MDELEKLKEENEELKTKLIDLTFEMNYNKQTELLEFLRELYIDVKKELKERNKLTKHDILFSLKKNIEEFAKNNKLNL
jgi:predicted RNase H-like nuclease (RuvC/YqgF family)